MHDISTFLLFTKKITFIRSKSYLISDMEASNWNGLTCRYSQPILKEAKYRVNETWVDEFIIYVNCFFYHKILRSFFDQTYKFNQKRRTIKFYWWNILSDWMLIIDTLRFWNFKFWKFRTVLPANVPSFDL